MMTTKNVKLGRVQECLTLLATVDGATIDHYASAALAHDGRLKLAKTTCPEVPNAVVTLVRAGILRGPWLLAR